MARVCQEWFPETDGFYMDDLLKLQLDIMIKNVRKDWDFTILIGGSGEMRVGKSLLGMHLGAYWTYQIWKKYKILVPYNVKENLVLNGSELVKKGMRLGKRYKYCAINYDEAADDMEGSKVMQKSSQYIKDYLRKAAQFNMLNIIVQSEFFEVPKAIAISRSTAFINVKYNIDEEGNFRRGYFEFYSRRKKKLLYLLGKKLLDYSAVRPDFKGTFSNFYPVDEEEYREEKRRSLLDWKKLSDSEMRREEWLRSCLKYMYNNGLSHREVAAEVSKYGKIKMSHMTVGRMLAKDKQTAEEEDYEDV